MTRNYKTPRGEHRYNILNICQNRHYSTVQDTVLPPRIAQPEERICSLRVMSRREECYLRWRALSENLGQCWPTLMKIHSGAKWACRGGTKLADFPSESDLNVDLALTNVKKPASELP